MRRFISLVFFIVISFSAFSQFSLQNETVPVSNPDVPNGSIQGRITTTDNEPAPFVTVYLKGANRSTTTDENGFFIIKNVKEGSYTLEVSMIGLQTQEKRVDILKDKAVNLTITLTENTKQLTNVIIQARKTLNEKPVSIGKAPINPMDLPQSIAVIGQSVIKEQQALRLSDVVKNVNGVYLATTRGSVQESFAARGYSFSSTNLFKNGFRLNSGAMPEMSSLQKVEVLKGSAAILYGQVAPGGILNMVTKQPKFDFGGEIAMTAGSYDLYKPHFDIYGPINSSIAYRVNGTFETANSFRDNVSSKRYYVNPSLLFNLGQKTELLLEGDYLQHEFTPDFGIGSLDNTKIPGVPRSRFMGALWSNNTTKQATTTATIKHKLNDLWSVDASASYQKYYRDYFSTERIQAKANGDWDRPLGKIDTDETFFAGQLNLTGKFKTKAIEHILLAGTDADRSLTGNFDFDFPAVAGLPARSYDRINILDPNKYVGRTDMPSSTKIRERNAAVNRFGVYIQDLVKLSSKFNVLAGVRFSTIKTFGIDSTNLLNGSKTSGNDITNNAFSPRLGLVYKPAKTTSIFASYSNSFTVNSGQDIYGKTLPPSIIDQYEAGIKNDFFNGKLSTNVTLYRIVNNNLAQTAPFDKDGNINSNTSFKILAGQTTSDGVEFDIASQPVLGLSILAGYSYNYIRYTKTDSIKGNFIEGERLVNNPAHTANASIFYTFSNTLKGLKLGATAVYIGERIGGWNNTIGQAQNYSRMIPVEAYTTIDVSAGYSFKNISLMAKVSNIANTLNYYVHENYSINPIPPRQIVGTISYKF